MKRHTVIEHDPYWNEDILLFAGKFHYYRDSRQNVRAKLHVSNERYFDKRDEIVPVQTRNGTRTYVHFQPYVVEPVITFTVNVQPKVYADLGETLGKVDSSKVSGTRDNPLGNAQAWYYHEDNILILWECFLEQLYRDAPVEKDMNMRHLWLRVEHYLLHRFPQAKTLVTPYTDPLFPSNDYQALLRSLGYTSVSQAAFGKPL